MCHTYVEIVLGVFPVIVVTSLFIMRGGEKVQHVVKKLGFFLEGNPTQNFCVNSWVYIQKIRVFVLWQDVVENCCRMFSNLPMVCNQHIFLIPHKCFPYHVKCYERALCVACGI